MKLAIVITSDPQGGEEALGRVFNALALAAEAQGQDDQVEVVFVGAGTRWPAQLSKLGHPVAELYGVVRARVVGASAGCAAVFGATSGVEQSGLVALRDHPLPGTPGLASLRRYLADGWQTLVF